jgi:hypothetical protein
VGDFVHALIAADIGRELWRVKDPDLDLRYRRTGGCAHKLIRWAFEAQGLFGSGNEVDGPGLPPPVDIYISSRRTQQFDVFEHLCHSPGSYAPVDLDSDALAAGTSFLMADAAALSVQGSTVCVTIGNRGTMSATNVEVNLFTAPRSECVPHWNALDAWTHVASGSIAEITAGNPGVSVTLAANLSNVFILAVASCAADRANVDVATALPCSYLPTPMIDLLAGDNNLGFCLA